MTLFLIMDCFGSGYQFLNATSNTKMANKMLIGVRGYTFERTYFLSISLASSKNGHVEFELLEKLFTNAPEATNKADLVKLSLGETGTETPQQIRSLEVKISRMRRRFSTDDSPLPIKSLRNVGYIFHGNCKITD